jgi:hypothetical protein
VAVAPGTPEQGIPATFTFSGSSQAIDEDGDGPYLVAEFRPTGGVGCQDSYADDQTAAGGASTTVFGYDGVTDDDAPTEGPGGFSDPYHWAMPNKGSYLLCAWLQDNEGDTTYASASVTFNVTGPVVSAFQVALPEAASPGKQFLINYTTQTDQQLALYSVIQRAGGQPCPTSYELAQSENLTSDQVNFEFENNEDNSSNSLSVYGGPATAQAADTETKAGSYVICSWIEGPNTAEVDDSASTPFYVGTPPPPPDCVVPKLGSRTPLATAEAALASAHCGIGAVSYKHSKRVPSGDVLKIKPVSHTKHANGAKVSLVVSSGPVPPPCVVPRVGSHTPLAEAETRLAAARCGVGTVTNSYSKKIPTGDVVAFKPRPHTKLANGAKVSIVVSSGKRPK